MKIRFDGSSFLEVDTPSGVGHYSRLLYQSLAVSNSVELTTGPFFRSTDPDSRPTKLQTVLNKAYRKLTSYGFGVPFDLLMPRVDLTIFPNFAHWPSARSTVTSATIHDLTYLYFPELVEEKNLAYLRRVVPVAVDRSDFVITVSEAVKSELVKEFSVPADKIVTTPIPPDPIYLDSPTKDIKNKYRIHYEDYILFFGNLEPRKNLKTLVEAYAKLPKDIGQKYGLVLAGGKGWQISETQEVIDRAVSQGANITHIGYVDQEDAPSLYREASLFVMPSLYEGFGMPIIEAFASKTPVVAASIPVLKETAAGGAALANPKDPSDFVEEITKILTESSYADSFTSAAQKQLKSLTWDINCANIINKTQSISKERIMR